MKKIVSAWLFLSFAFISGCASLQSRSTTDFFPEIVSGNVAAVSFISEASTGDITALGNRWRDRIETSLAEKGVIVKARRDITVLIDDIESFGRSGSEKEIWEEAGADIIVCGSYTIFDDTQGSGTMLSSKSGGHVIKIIVKAYRISDSSLISSREINEKLDPDWAALASKIVGNIHQESLAIVSSNLSKNGLPRLSATLDRNPSCYPAGSNASITISTEPGIYLYIFNLAADQTVTILYPNRFMQNNPLVSGEVIFPPPNADSANKSMELVLYPLEQDKLCRESFKIVTSREKLDFSFLPVPENKIFAGAGGGDIGKMTKVLKANNNFSEVLLTYFVGKGCR